jgi:hypothetical protein
MRELVEERLVELVDAYFEAARSSVLVAKYEGEVNVSDVPDHAARIAVYERLLDRVYGKPGQHVEVKGSETGDPLAVIVAGDDPAARKAASDAARELLRQLVPRP